ncbi:polymorphic toxin type 46 domain-containing protein [Rhizobium halophytocola]|uniref:Bacterial toxin 46 domain-containing protein n=1 Tax=Rhizobium halophytocola TaxID=735519 RepID=A0ABS4E662_9HYPH|nr:polymorphic toxin type 46 domain-containing protein [Rhizobium halophytocola]MBP1853437.1 hypothetical protein [Rhizobium halophytocola]
MGSAAAFTDVQTDDTHTDGSSCVVYATDKAYEYAATVRFIGLLAGVGSSDDVTAARALVKRMIDELGIPTDLRKATDEEERTRSEMEKAQHEFELASILHGQNSGAAQEALLAKNSTAQAFEQAQAQRTALMHQSFKDFWSNLWASLKDTYNSIIAAFQNGTWKVALCKASVDAGFSIIETGVAAALTAMGMAGAAMFLKIVARVTAKGSRLVKITVKASRNIMKKRVVEAGLGKADVQEDFYRALDVDAELTDAEKRVLGSDNMGNTTKDRDHGHADTDPKRLAKPISRLDWRKELNSRGVSDADIALAGESGKTPAHIAARRKMVTAYSEAYHGDTDNLTGGTSFNLSQPIRVRPISANEKMFQWNGEGRPPGNWVDPTNAGDPHGLGIAPYGREGTSVSFTEDAHGLLGTGARAADAGDDWTTKSSSFQYRGGGQQLYVPDDMKPAISLDSTRPKVPWREAIRGNEADIGRSTTLKTGWEDILLDESLKYGRSYKNFSDIVDFYDQWVTKSP